MTDPFSGPPPTRPGGPGPDHAWGHPDAPLTITVYGDYSCPRCAGLHLGLATLRGRPLGASVRHVFRQFPQNGPAVMAAQAAVAAGAQGAFWPMHDLLMTARGRLEAADLVRYASSLGLDVVRFSGELERRVYLPEVEADLAAGAQLGVREAPGVFINGAAYHGPLDPASLAERLSQELGPVDRPQWDQA